MTEENTTPEALDDAEISEEDLEDVAGGMSAGKAMSLKLQREKDLMRAEDAKNRRR